MYPLAEGEQLLWSGRPQRYVRRYRDYHHYVVVAIVIVGGLAVAATSGLDYGGMVGCNAVAGVMIGFAVERNRERRGFIAGTTYLVTDRRLIFVSQWPPGVEFRWVQLAVLRPPRVRDHGDGTGTIDFHPTVSE
ncbi:hypothetical protein ATK30_5723 [Amycolatopsis echigonensis]|uniref:Uncharacterized protein n=1 Tax=Amycolatopsis echigonensis TaxID=2576905 RepID=A0A2N3WLU3_9PSEU|nr:hypothetical protein [Amycolatopsis niigatensis]PKV94835.1 hypothetical protein ATK30_5723 [Amycolatopsis niigatensis]